MRRIDANGRRVRPKRLVVAPETFQDLAAFEVERRGARRALQAFVEEPNRGFACVPIDHADAIGTSRRRMSVAIKSALPVAAHTSAIAPFHPASANTRPPKVPMTLEPR